MSETVEDQIASELKPDAELPPDDNQPEPEPEPNEPEPGEPEPAPDQPDSEAAIEERGKRFDNLTKHVAKRTGEILGDDISLVTQCPFCTYYNMPGWVPVISHPLELQTVVLHAFGQHAPADYAKDSYSRECDKCRGLGSVLTGSKVAGSDKLPCFDCSGAGWIPVGNERLAPGSPGWTATVQTPALEGTNGSPPPMLDVPLSPAAEAARKEGYMVVKLPTG